MRALIFCLRANPFIWFGAAMAAMGSWMTLYFWNTVHLTPSIVVLALGAGLTGVPLRNTLVAHRRAYRGIVLRSGVLERAFTSRWTRISGCFSMGFRAAITRWESENPQARVVFVRR